MSILSLVLDSAPAYTAPRVLRKTRNEATVTGGVLGDRVVTIRRLTGAGD